MIIYIAGRIKDDPDYKIKFHAAEEYLKEMGHKVLNPASLPLGLPEEAYMPICLAMLNAAEAIFMLEGAEQSDGAMLERNFAIYQNKVIILDPVRVKE